MGLMCGLENGKFPAGATKMLYQMFIFLLPVG